MLNIENLVEVARSTFGQKESFQMLVSSTSEKCNFYYI